MSTPPREGFRAVFPASIKFEERADSEGNGRTMSGHFAVFNEWTLIDSAYEGRFRERIAPGAFTKTFKERVPKVLFQHGRDNYVGDKPLGTITSLTEDERGAAYEVDMLDTAYNRDLIPGLKAGVYGASFRFSVVREDYVRSPEASDANPDGEDERTIREARVSEFGPVTFGAYENATSGVRSVTDDVFLRAMAQNPEKFAPYLADQEELLRAVIDITKQRKVIDLGDLARDNATDDPPVEDAVRQDTSDTRRENELEPLKWFVTRRSVKEKVA